MRTARVDLSVTQQRLGAADDTAGVGAPGVLSLKNDFAGLFGNGDRQRSAGGYVQTCFAAQQITLRRKIVATGVLFTDRVVAPNHGSVFGIHSTQVNRFMRKHAGTKVRRITIDQHASSYRPT